MGLGGKKAKAKEKNGKVGVKQKIKKAKSPEVTEVVQPTENIEHTEVQTAIETPLPAPDSPELVLQELESIQPSEPAFENAISIEDFLVEDIPSAPPSPLAPSVPLAIVDNGEEHEEQPSETLNEPTFDSDDHLINHRGDLHVEHCTERRQEHDQEHCQEHRDEHPHEHTNDLHGKHQDGDREEHRDELPAEHPVTNQDEYCSNRRDNHRDEHRAERRRRHRVHKAEQYTDSYHDPGSQPTTRRGTPNPQLDAEQAHPTYEETYPQYPAYPGYPTYPTYPTEYPEGTVIATPLAPFSPTPAQVPLPSPSLTEARFMSSASPEAHYYPYYPPAPLPYAPYAASVYSAPYYHSPVPKVSSPLARSHYSYISPAMSPTATPPPPAAPPAPAAPSNSSTPMPPPSISQGYPTAVHSPVMSSAGMIPPYGPYTPPRPSESHYMQRSYSVSDQPYASSFQAIQNLNLNHLSNGQMNENGNISPPENDQEHIELLHRIQSAIPDINRLLHGFRHTHTRLNSREAEIKQIGSQHEQALMHKDFYIEALQSQMKKAANESADECAKLKNTINELRLQLGDLQEKQKDLEDGLAGHQKTNEELSRSKSELEAEVEKLNARIKEAQETHEKELETQKEELAKSLATQKQELTELFEEIKAEDEKAAAETLETREKELRDQHESSKEEWGKEKKLMEDTLETQRGELEATKTELASKIAALETKEAELETQLAELNTTREEVASKVALLDAKEKELEETRNKNAEELEALQRGHSGEQDALRDGHAGELDSLRQTYDEQLAAAAKELNEKIAAIEAQFLEQEKHWEAERAALQKLLAERGEELNSAEREKDKLEGDGLVKEQQLQRAVEEMRSTIDHLDQDCDRLRRTLQSLGEATDLKTTKGDQFFVDCFTQLSSLIADLSHEYFAYLPIDPPKDILSKIPSEIPSFLDNTPASRALRAAYVQHVVSKTLTYRVFQPFLFTLGRRYDKADTFFQMLSMDIRRKSVRREAFWRQQTLKAAYTTSDAKQSINVAAAVIVDEIIDHIRHFADPRQLDALLTAVRKIVKLAAETWRHARVERELVLASFPAPDAEAIDNEGWSEYGAKEGESTPAPAEAPKPAPSRHVILRTFPRVVREAAHEDFALGPNRATSCVYTSGQVLYSDSPVVMARLLELAKKSTENVVVVEEQKPVEEKKVEEEKVEEKKVEETPPSPPQTPKDQEVTVEPAVVPEVIATVRSSTPTPVKSPPLVKNSAPARNSSVPANTARGKGPSVKP